MPGGGDGQRVNLADTKPLFGLEKMIELRAVSAKLFILVIDRGKSLLNLGDSAADRDTPAPTGEMLPGRRARACAG